MPSQGYSIVVGTRLPFAPSPLEDRNLPAIAEKRVLKPLSEAARSETDAAFEQTAKVREAGETAMSACLVRAAELSPILEAFN